MAKDLTGPPGRGLETVPGQFATAVRFFAVGVTATLGYFGVSLLLLRAGMWPQLVNLIAFGASLLLSYAGHYFFTYRSREAHSRTGTRFAIITLVLLLLCSAVQQLALWSDVPPEGASLIVAVVYPPLSFLLNHFWAFARKHDDLAAGGRR
jgi:putative flippase GtrA